MLYTALDCFCVIEFNLNLKCEGKRVVLRTVVVNYFFAVEKKSHYLKSFVTKNDYGILDQSLIDLGGPTVFTRHRITRSRFRYVVNELLNWSDLVFWGVTQIEFCYPSTHGMGNSLV